MQMNLPMGQELEFVSSRTGFVKDCEGADVLVVKLLLGSREMKVGGIQPYTVTDLVVMGSMPLLVVLCLHVVGSLLEGVTSLLVDL